MYVSSKASSSATADAAGASRPETRPISKTRAAVEQQLAHNSELSKANASKLAKYSDTTATTAKAATTDAAATSNKAATTAAAGTTAAASTKTPAGSTATATKSSERHSAIFAKQQAYNQSQAKINAAFLAKFSAKDSTSAPSQASGSDANAAQAAQAATSKYLANDGSQPKTSTTLFHA